MTCNGNTNAYNGSNISVSIPIGFSNDLQRPTACGGAEIYSRFQSLLGFLMTCNVWAFRGPRYLPDGFNPYWVF